MLEHLKFIFLATKKGYNGFILNFDNMLMKPTHVVIRTWFYNVDYT